MKDKLAYLIISIVFYLITAFYMYNGFNFLNNYDTERHVNVWVGGDAYNYIINAGKANANFTIALIFCIVATAFLIFYMNRPKVDIEDDDEYENDEYEDDEDDGDDDETYK